MDYLYALQCIREGCPSFINIFFVLISEVILKAGVIIGALIYWCVNKSEGITLLLGYTSTYQINQLVKNTACVYRPWIKDSRLHLAPEAVKTATGYSFPSGHTVTAASIFGGISVWQKKRKWLVVLMSLLILLVAFARNWLGAHTLTDVVTAICETAVVLIVVYALRYLVLTKRNFDTILCFGGIGIAVVLLIVLSLKGYPMDYDSNGILLADPYAMLTDCYTAFGMLCGTLLGWWLERRFINFSVEGKFSTRLLRFACGLIMILIPYLGSKYVFAIFGDHWCHLIKYFLVMIVATAVYPAIIKLVQIKKQAKLNRR